jgi:TetR/AcrR family transcriptional regulator, transcriptional repressor for nem operon
MGRTASSEIRERLLEAGFETFRRMGFNGCSVQDITDAAGVPKGSFYNHFESKEALAAAALQRYWGEAQEHGVRVLADATRSPRERLLIYFDQVIRDIASQQFRCGCLAGNMAAELADHSPLISQQLSTIFAGWNREVSNCIRAAQEAGEVRSDADPEALAAFILNAWEGAVLRARIEKGERPLRQFHQVLSTELLR